MAPQPRHKQIIKRRRRRSSAIDASGREPFAGDLRRSRWIGFKKAVVQKQWAIEQSERAEDTRRDRKINKLRPIVEQEFDADVGNNIKSSLKKCP